MDHLAPKKVRAESRIFPALTIVALLVLLEILPERYRVVPGWVAYVVAVAVIGPMFAASSTPRESIWARIEAIVLIIALSFTMLLVLRTLYSLVEAMITKPSISPTVLLSTSVGIWVTNVLVYAFAYWLLDRGGPWGRAQRLQVRADFSFPRGDEGDLFPADWQPVFADYLFVGFNTSTAFSPTDALPLTTRAKMLMLTQSCVSLVTVVVVAARAINIIGS
jgi:hypothetical protein